MFCQFVDAVVIAENNEIARTAAEPSSASPSQCVNPLTKEQLQQAFIYLLQVSQLCVLMLVYLLTWLVMSSVGSCT